MPKPGAGFKGRGTENTLRTHRDLQFALRMEHERLFRNSTLDKSTAGLGTPGIDSSIPIPGSV